MDLTICIIDDDLVSQFATQYRIGQSIPHCKVVSFDSAEEGLDYFKQHLPGDGHFPDILLLDIVMSEMSGWDFLLEMENFFGGQPDMDVYVLSAFQNMSDRMLAKKHPLIQGYFDKPISKDNVETILGARKV